MELGIDKKQIEGMKQWFLGLSKDRVMLRFVVCLVIFAVGWFAVLDPQAAALAKARKGLATARKQDVRASEAVFYTKQLEGYESHLFESDDPLLLQDYVLDKVDKSGAMLRGTANKKADPRGVFKVIELDLAATGTYSQLADLVDRLERGDKVVRLEKCRLQATKTQIILEATVNALVKPALAARKRAEAADTGDTEGAAEDAEDVGADARGDSQGVGDDPEADAPGADAVDDDPPAADGGGPP